MIKMFMKSKSDVYSSHRDLSLVFGKIELSFSIEFQTYYPEGNVYFDIIRTYRDKDLWAISYYAKIRGFYLQIMLSRGINYIHRLEGLTKPINKEKDND